jgi:phospholipid-translocating ATPase
MTFPQLYARGIKGLDYTRTKFWLYMFDGFYQSAVVFFIPFLSFTGGASVSWTGKVLDSLADLGTTVAISAIFSANIFVGLNTK